MSTDRHGTGSPAATAAGATPPPHRADIVSELFARYYAAGHRASDMSSHWQAYSSQFDVQVDASGTVTALEGAGFGGLKSGSLPRRLMHQLATFSHLAHLPQRRRLAARRDDLRRVCQSMGLDPTLDAFRQLCTLDAVAEAAAARCIEPTRFLMIGDGFGVLSSLIKNQWPAASLVLVDLGQTLLFQAYYCQKAHPMRRHALASTPAAAGADFIYCPSDRMADLAALQFDVAINVASMQEMNPSTVESYFAFMRQHLRARNLFYCCNRVSKTLPDGQTSMFEQYPWSAADEVLTDGLCPWHQYFLTAGVSRNAPRLAGIPIPCVSYYDGPHQHRLVSLHTMEQS